MNTSRRRADGGIRVVPRDRVCGLVVVCWLVVVCCAGPTLLSKPAAAQAPTTSRQELMRKWDIDRDGKVDASEAEIARGRMRRSRNEAIMHSGTDPVTGRPRVATDPVTGRPLQPEAAATDRGGVPATDDDEGLILVPGNGEKPRAAGDTAAGDGFPPRPSQRDREPLPGTRAPMPSATIPSVSPRLSTGVPPGGVPPGPSNGLSSGAPVPDTGSRLPGSPSATGRQGLPRSRDAGGTELSSRARVLPGQSPAQNPAWNPSRNSSQNPTGRGPQSFGSGQDRQQPGARPGIIAGGVRAGAPGARPGYGGGGVPPDLNAGRSIGQVPVVPRPGIGPYRGATPSGGPAVGVPSMPRPGGGAGMGQPNGGPSVSRSPSTQPRVPRMTTDEFYGR